MKRWYDEEFGGNVCEPDCCDEWLELIWMVGVDYDGYENDIKGLRDLVDELVDMSKRARECLHDGLLFSKDGEEK